MSQPEQLITEHMDIWTSAILAKSTAGRGSSKKYELYGIKKLRELILELAVRGKLVPQDANDEPASVLLEKIEVEKAQLVKEGKIKKSKLLAKIDKDEKLFELPKGWQWCRLREIGHDWGQKKPDVDFTYIDVGSINKKLGLIEDARITHAEEAPSRARKLVKKGTVLYSTVRPYLLNIAVVDKNIFPEPIASTAFAIIHPLEGVSSSFIYRYLRSPSFVGYVESCQTGIAYPAINDKQFFNGLIPLPPKEEQNRIVAKVDELMLLCDQLEQQTEASIDAHAILVEVLLATLTDSADANELAQNWARVSEYFDSLFTTEKSIEALKQTVLQLAVMGKLVPQNPDDEPASVLIERIAVEKVRLIQEKKIKKAKLLPAIRDDEKPFELPHGWEWCRFGSMVNFKAELVKPEKYLDYEQVGPDSIEKGTGKLIKRRTVRESGITGPNSKFYSGQILYSKIRPSLSKAVIVNFDGLCSADMYPLEALVRPDYLLTAILSEVFLAQVRDAENRIKMPKVNIESLSMMIIPICSNQMMIAVTQKVDELMTICDQLKDKLQQSQVTQVQLTDALIEGALA